MSNRDGVPKEIWVRPCFAVTLQIDVGAEWGHELFPSRQAALEDCVICFYYDKTCPHREDLSTLNMLPWRVRRIWPTTRTSLVDFTHEPGSADTNAATGKDGD